MKVVLQRVREASVETEGKVIGKIGRGLLVFLGVSGQDTEEVADKYLNKIIKLRIFEDKDGKTNLSLQDVGGEILVVSQFTLYADCRKGNRPSFTEAGPPELANRLYEYFIEKVKEKLGQAACGSFGADMKVSLVNDGPFTVVLDDEAVIKNSK